MEILATLVTVSAISNKPWSTTSIAKEVGDRAGEGGAYGNLGNACHGLGDFKQALEYHKQRLSIAKEVGDRAGEGRAYGNLGSACDGLGDFKQALEYHKQRLSIAKEVGDRAGEGHAYGNLGSDCHRIGDFKQALEYHRQHLSIAKEVGDRAGEGHAYGHLGNVYLCLRNFRKATDYRIQSLSISKEIGDRSMELLSYLTLGDIRRDLGDLKGSSDYYLQGRKIAREIGSKALKSVLYCRLGRFYRHHGDLKIAKEYDKQHLDMAKETGDRCGEGCACLSIGRDHELSGCLNRALKFYRSSVRAYDGVRCLLRDEDVRKVNFRDYHQAAYTALWTTLVKLSKTDEALSAAEQGRGQALTDLMELQYGIKLPPSGSFDLKEIISSRVVDVSTQIVYVALEDKKINLWVLSQGNEVQFRQNGVGGHKYIERVMTNTFKDNVGRCVRIKDRTSGKPADELTRKGEFGMSVQLSKGNKNSLRLLHCSIFGPIAKLLRGDEIIIVPDGALCLAPFAAFLDDFSRYLSESFRIRVIPSLTSLKLVADAPEDYHSKSGALLVGDPCLKEITNIFGQPKMTQLPYAREEVRMIGEILNTTPLTGEAASKDEVLRRIGSVAIVHIAAHGQSGSGQIYLAPNPARKNKYPQEDDYILKIADVRAVQLRAKLVVLSCCHSGQGDVKAEGVVGIARVFLGAGARSVLVTLWAVDDEATMEFMKRFYQHLRDGKSASVSLSLAMKYLRGTEKFSAVKYWAPFQLIGDDVTLEFGEIEHRE